MRSPSMISKGKRVSRFHQMAASLTNPIHRPPSFQFFQCRPQVLFKTIEVEDDILKIPAFQIWRYPLQQLLGRAGKLSAIPVEFC